MGFESGNVSLRVFYLPQSLPDDHVQKFAAHAAAPLETLGRADRHILAHRIVAGFIEVHGPVVELFRNGFGVHHPAFVRRKRPGVRILECLNDQFDVFRFSGVNQVHDSNPANQPPLPYAGPVSADFRERQDGYRPFQKV